MNSSQPATITSPLPVAPTGDPLVYIQGFDSLTEETVIDSLPVSGTIPAWLTGSLLRTGPALYEIGSTKVSHWFDGMAMLHTFSFGESGVSYRNKFLGSKAYIAARETGELQYSEFATDPCRSIFKRMASAFNPKVTDNGAVNITRIGEDFIAMTETPMVVQFDPETLETLSVDHRANAPGDVATAHPHHDKQRRGMLNYAVKFGRRSEYRFYVAADHGGEPQVIARAGTAEPGYVHSFGITDKYIVLFVPPFTVNPLKLAANGIKGKSFIESFEWKPQNGSEFLVFERSSGFLVNRISAPPLFCFHHVNAYEDGDQLVVDLVAFKDHKVIDALYLDRLRSGGFIPHAALTRFRLNLAAGRTSSVDSGEELYDGLFELPRINYKNNNGKPYRYAYGASAQEGDPEGGYGIFDTIVKVDVTTRAATQWHEPGQFPGEPVFVPRPNGDSEDDGVLLTVVLSAEARHSEMVVIDARSMNEIARATVPHHIPFGFHGSYYGDV